MEQWYLTNQFLIHVLSPVMIVLMFKKSAHQQNWLYRVFGGQHLWIGINDYGSEGTWVWADGTPVSYTNWNSGEPNSGGNYDGGFMYMLQGGGQSAFPRSAAGIVALYSAGIYEGTEITKGLEFLHHYIPKGTAYNRESHYFYGHYYAVQAMWHAGGENWAKWYPPRLKRP